MQLSSSTSCSVLWRLGCFLCAVSCADFNPVSRRLRSAQQCETDFFATDTPRCERCAIRLLHVKSGVARVCGRCLADTPHFDTTMTLGDYVSPVDGMVMALKFTARLDLAQFFGRMLASRVSAMSAFRER